MEIYNENIADLLAGRSNIPGNKGLSVREDQSGVTFVADLKEEYVTDGSGVSLLVYCWVRIIVLYYLVILCICTYYYVSWPRNTVFR